MSSPSIRAAPNAGSRVPLSTGSPHRSGQARRTLGLGPSPRRTLTSRTCNGTSATLRNVRRPPVPCTSYRRLPATPRAPRPATIPYWPSGLRSSPKLLDRELHRLPHEVQVAAGAKRVQKLGQADWSRALVGLLLRDPGLRHAEDPRWPPLAGGSLRPQIPLLRGALTRTCPRLDRRRAAVRRWPVTASLGTSTVRHLG
jgi:hypothetical protein